VIVKEPGCRHEDAFALHYFNTRYTGKLVHITDGAITVNDIAVSDADILAINGVSHGID
jgi:uncharacterized surface protein with fasciclin (FAS1) repeats